MQARPLLTTYSLAPQLFASHQLVYLLQYLLGYHCPANLSHLLDPLLLCRLQLPAELQYLALGDLFHHHCQLRFLIL